MRKGGFLLFFLFLSVVLVAQQRPDSRGREGGVRNMRGTENSSEEMPIDSLNNRETGPLSFRAYTLSDKLGVASDALLDTGRFNTSNHTLMEGIRRGLAYTGNIGAPSQSRLFSEREEPRHFIFADAYAPFIITPTNGRWYDTRTPFTDLLYTRSGGIKNREEQFRGTLTSNFGKQLNVGAEFDYIYSRGHYNSNANKLFTYRLFSSYRSDRYEAYAHLRMFNFVNNENGGITNDRYITHPDDFSFGKRKMDSKAIPTRFSDTWNRVRGTNYFLTHRYNLGFFRKLSEKEQQKQQEEEEAYEKKRLEQQLKDDGEEQEPVIASTAQTAPRKVKKKHHNELFVPVSSVIHTVEYENYSRRFISTRSDAIDTCYFPHYGTIDSTLNDYTSAWSLKNTLALSLREGFHDWAKFGLTAFIHFEKRQFSLPGDSVVGKVKYDEYATTIGAELAKTTGDLLQYHARGELCLIGSDIGAFNINGTVKTQFQLFDKKASIQANGYIKNIAPPFYMRHHHGRYFWWDQNRNYTQRLYVGGAAHLEQTGTTLSAGVESIQNHLFFNTQGVPDQYTKNLQVISARLNQDMRFKSFSWENEVTYQLSSNQKVLALPAICAYTNMYVSMKPVKVLTLQLGAEMHYFTAYYAPHYEPATLQFQQQEELMIGNYPLINAYANFHLKQTRFFVMAYNLGRLFIPPNDFSLPHYPLNPFIVKIGLTVHFIN